MTSLGYLFAAYTIVWLALLAYLLFVTSSIGSLRKSIQALRDLLAEDELAAGGLSTKRHRTDATEQPPLP